VDEPAPVWARQTLTETVASKVAPAVALTDQSPNWVLLRLGVLTPESRLFISLKVVVNSLPESPDTGVKLMLAQAPALAQGMPDENVSLVPLNVRSPIPFPWVLPPVPGLTVTGVEVTAKRGMGLAGKNAPTFVCPGITPLNVTEQLPPAEVT